MDNNLINKNLTDRENSLFYDVDVPEIVQIKADIAFSRIKMERENAMKETITKENTTNINKRRKTFTRLLLGTAACAAAAAGIANGARGYSAPDKKTDIAARITETKKDDTLFSVMDNIFTMRVEAAKLTKKQPVPVTDISPASRNDSNIHGNKADSWNLGSVEDGVINYCINMPLSCTGNNIDKVTYHINNGAFQIVQPVGESIIVDGQLYEKQLNTGSIGGDYNEENGGQPSRPFETVLYQSFTLDYKKQSDDNTWINICNERPDCEEAINLIWGDHEHSLEDDNKAMHQMLEGTTITCTVQYKDGTTQSADILVDTQIMSHSETGKDVKSDLSDEKSVFVTFELQ